MSLYDHCTPADKADCTEVCKFLKIYLRAYKNIHPYIGICQELGDEKIKTVYPEAPDGACAETL